MGRRAHVTLVAAPWVGTSGRNFWEDIVVSLCLWYTSILAIYWGMLMMMMMVMMNQDICWFNYRTWWRRGIYPSTMGHIMGMRINHQWWGSSCFVLWLTYGVYLKKQPVNFHMMRKMMRKTSGISLSVKNKGIMMRKASGFFGSTFQTYQLR